MSRIEAKRVLTGKSVHIDGEYSCVFGFEVVVKFCSSAKARHLRVCAVMAGASSRALS
jgi:hypothetical protein